MSMNRASYIRAASLIAIGAGLVSWQPAWAQQAPAFSQNASDQAASTPPKPASDTADTAAQEIVVTGFRSSLAQALNVKKEQAAAVDTILAEDVGKFPDSNLAESMQRLPGVSKWSFSFGAEANQPASFLGNEGEVYIGYDGSYRSRFSSNASPSLYTWVDGYSLSNFRAGFRTPEGLNIFAWVRNAFDEEYFEQLAVGPSNTGLIAGQPGDPRTWGVTIKAAF